MNKQNILLTVVFFVFLIGVIWVLNAGSRWVSSTTVVERIYSPRPGIECLVVTSSDGIATSCYSTVGLPEPRREP